MQPYSNFHLAIARSSIFLLFLGVITSLLLITSCSNTPRLGQSTPQTHIKKAPSSLENKHGGYYLDDGPEQNPPSNLDTVPDATPRLEPLKTSTMRPYVAFGKTYTPMTTLKPYKERGQASWYGKRYHGKNTASGEIYDMYAMTAAHPTLPIPSYVRVTHLQNGQSVIVRINDRGPFLANRLIDLSYVAAYKLGVLANGHAQVEVESIIPGRTQAGMTQSTGKPETTTSGTNAEEVYLQLAAFSSAHNARSYLAQLKSDFPSIVDQSRINTANGLYKILVGPFPDSATATRTADIISRSGVTKPILVQHSRIYRDTY